VQKKKLEAERGYRALNWTGPFTRGYKTLKTYDGRGKEGEMKKFRGVERKGGRQ